MTSPATPRALARRASFLLVLLAGAVLLALPATSAQAAPPPFVTATPTDVVIPVGTPSGPYLLAWDPGGQSGLELWASINNGAEFGPQPVTAAGTFNASINFGDTHQWKLYTKGKRRLLSQTDITTRRPDDACKRTCIKGVEPEVHGTWARLNVVTTHPEKLDLKIADPFQNTQNAQGASNAQNKFSADFLDLTSSTTYDFSVTATDELGNQQTVTGKFTTLERKLSVNFQKIDVTDDSDDLSAGDLTFSYTVDGAWDGFQTTASVDTGSSISPNHIVNVNKAPAVVELATWGIDDDCTTPFEFCSYGSAPGGSLGGSVNDYDWATATAQVGLYKTGVNEAFGGTVDFATSQWSLKFKVRATYTVSYS